MKPCTFFGGWGNEERSFAALFFLVFDVVFLARKISEQGIVGRKTSALVAAVLLGGVAYDASAQIQLVQNGSFEFIDEFGMPVGWTLSGFTDVGDVGFPQLQGYAHSGVTVASFRSADG